jgi:hypothetical protein
MYIRSFSHVCSTYTGSALVPVGAYVERGAASRTLRVASHEGILEDGRQAEEFEADYAGTRVHFQTLRGLS